MSLSHLQTPAATIAERAQLELIRDVSGMCLAEATEIPPEPLHRTPLEIVNMIAGAAIDFSDTHAVPIDPVEFTREQVAVIDDLAVIALFGTSTKLHEIAHQLRQDYSTAA